MLLMMMVLVTVMVVVAAVTVKVRLIVTDKQFFSDTGKGKAVNVNPLRLRPAANPYSTIDSMRPSTACSVAPALRAL